MMISIIIVNTLELQIFFLFLFLWTVFFKSRLVRPNGSLTYENEEYFNRYCQTAFPKGCSNWQISIALKFMGMMVLCYLIQFTTVLFFLFFASFMGQNGTSLLLYLASSWLLRLSLFSLCFETLGFLLMWISCSYYLVNFKVPFTICRNV